MHSPLSLNDPSKGPHPRGSAEHSRRFAAFAAAVILLLVIGAIVIYVLILHRHTVQPAT